MDLYVITAAGMGFPETRCCAAVFSSRSAALADAKARGIDNPRIEHHILHGKLVSDTVYAAHVYEQAPDMFDLLGLYADFDTGKRAVGKPSMVTQHTIDPKIESSSAP